ncbi:hypothetical protein AA12717_3936 [Gluconacetobacter sacchari DSM 12717]|uniref:Uncharacterized protein n=3 Tax=Gluconacetobacter sacchari TaxID=92759 RepID=A0A7W4IB32_9PROT|nr:hypothetical protein [Gluconacetobacter sacchari]MBB2159517.1 hypothetical protein [Gluconacetobacter sacchari]GBQ32073.1 hypothetical protein AA12717_3936 [Gluconacetobacter sacchari DSM 12717]
MRFSRAVWYVPLVLALVTGLGLVLALLLDGPVGDICGIVGLGVPCGVICRCLLRATR